MLFSTLRDENRILVEVEIRHSSEAQNPISDPYVFTYHIRHLDKFSNYHLAVSILEMMEYKCTGTSTVLEQVTI